MDTKGKSVPLDGDSGIEYEIRIKGYLEEHWSDWLGGLEITQDSKGYSLLIGIVPDQAALHGILAQIRDLGLTLISLTARKASDLDSGVDAEMPEGSDAQNTRLTTSR